MSYKVGYWVDLTGMQFGDSGLTWIQAMPLGSYEHPVHGTIEITPERVQRFAVNVKANVRGQDLDIDYDHKERSGEAAGWVRDAEARSDGLWLAVEWTKAAATKIREKAYRYFSPEFVDEWTHPKSSQKFEDVLFGGGITNRPFLKDVLPINMSELFSEHPKHPEQNPGGIGMDPKKLRELLGLQESAADNDVEAAIKKLKETPPTPPPSNDPGNDPQLVQLAESNPLIKQMLDMQKGMQQQLAETQAALQLSEVTSTITRLNEGKEYQIPAVVLNELPGALVQMQKTLREKVVGVLTKLTETGLVHVKEIGNNNGSGRESQTDDIKAFTDKVSTVMEGNSKLDYAAAVNHVALTEPQLFEAYRKASFIGVEN
jgi:hypothetical protein